jgi:N utilization substance protein B
MITRRSRAREVTLQLLYQREQNPQIERETVEAFARQRLKETVVIPFCLSLYDGVAANATEIDRRLSEAADNWKLNRMAAVDRNVLRLGAYELLFTPETPANVVLDEAVELARRYGSADSPAFVNGVLDRLRPATAPA